MFGTIAHNYLVGGESEAVFALQLCANGFAQRQVAWHWAVEREIVVDCLLGSLLDVVGVQKSGSPTDKLITSTPCALSSLLFCDMARVADGANPWILSEI